MLQTTADMLDAAPGLRARMAIWLHVVLDLPVNIGRQQLNYAGGIMHNSMPNYIKRNSLMAGALLVPFFAALTANGLDKVFNNHDLHNSWLWHSPAIGLWVIWFPIVALCLAVGSYLIFVFTRSSANKRSWLRKAFDLAHAWPVLLTGLIALSILMLLEFHDSAHCWVQTPTHLASHLQQTWQCSESNRAVIFRVLRHSFSAH